MMKFLFLLFIGMVVAIRTTPKPQFMLKKFIINVPDKEGDQFLGAVDRCSFPSTVRERYLGYLCNGTYSYEKKDANDDDSVFKKFIKCVFIESGFGNQDGTLKIKKTAEEFPGGILYLDAMERCNKRASIPTDTSFNIFNCFLNNSRVVFKFSEKSLAGTKITCDPATVFIAPAA